MLTSLPAVLVSHVCSFLEPKELLVTLARTARTSRALLNPACFSQHALVLATYELLVLSSIGPPASLTLQPFHSRVLAECRLSVQLKPGSSVGWQQALDALDYFPTCRSFAAKASGGRSVQLAETELHALLHLPAVRSCVELRLDGFCRSSKAEQVRLVDAQQDGDRRIARVKRKRSPDTNHVDPTRRFSWKNIRLASITSLSLRLMGPSKGGASFLTAHTTLVHLAISIMVVSVAELTKIFNSSTALPLLSRFCLHDELPYVTEPAHSLASLVTALAATPVGASGRSRPITSLTLDLTTPVDVFAAAALMSGLTCLQVDQAMPGWLEEWTGTEERRSAFPLLQEYVSHMDWSCPVWDPLAHRLHQPARPAAAAGRDLLPFLQSMAQRPLVRLVVRIPKPVTCNAAAMAQLARCNRLSELEFNFSTRHPSAPTWVDWSDPSLFDTFNARCLPLLLSVRLQHVKLSADSIVALASAAPLLHDFGLSAVQLTCHPSVVCAILGGYCEWIEDIYVDDTLSHLWRTVHPADVTDAYDCALVSAGRSSAYKPFTQLRKLHTTMCWCTPPAVWHALLSLLQHAKRLRHVHSFCNHDPLTVVALKYLPCLASLSPHCVLPSTFGAFVQRKSKQTGRHLFVACSELIGSQCRGNFGTRWQLPVHPLELSDKESPAKGKTYELTDCAQKGRELLPSLLLRPRSGLFTRYQRSLGPTTEAVLARWAKRNFVAHDGMSGEATSDEAVDRADAAVPVNHHDFGPAVTLYRWLRVRREEDEEAVKHEKMADGVSGGIDVIREEKEP